jgi:SNF2 family DNA or RNA helicase
VNGVQMRMGRVGFGAQLRGVSSGSVEFHANSKHHNSVFAKVIVADRRIVFGPFSGDNAANVAASAADSFVLRAFGTRAAAATTFHRHLVSLVRKCEAQAQLLEARGDLAGAASALQSAAHGDYSYAGEVDNANGLDKFIESLTALVKATGSEEVVVDFASPGDKSQRDHVFDVLSARRLVAPNHAGVSLALDPEWKLQQWESLGNPVSVDETKTVIKARDPASDFQNDDGDDGLGHADAVLPPLQIDNKRPMRFKVESSRRGAQGEAPSATAFPSSVFPLLLLSYPWCPPYGDIQGGFGVGSDVFASHRASTTNIKAVPKVVTGGALLYVKKAGLAKFIQPTFNIRNPLSIHGGLGQRHVFLLGVQWAATGYGAFAVFPENPEVPLWKRALNMGPQMDAQMPTEPKRILGFYNTSIQAACAFDREARRVRGVNANTNFKVGSISLQNVLRHVANNISLGNPELIGTIRTNFDGVGLSSFAGSSEAVDDWLNLKRDRSGQFYGQAAALIQESPEGGAHPHAYLPPISTVNAAFVSAPLPSSKASGQTSHPVISVQPSASAAPPVAQAAAGAASVASASSSSSSTAPAQAPAPVYTDTGEPTVPFILEMNAGQVDVLCAQIAAMKKLTKAAKVTADDLSRATYVDTMDPRKSSRPRPGMVRPIGPAGLPYTAPFVSARPAARPMQRSTSSRRSGGRGREAEEDEEEEEEEDTEEEEEEEEEEINFDLIAAQKREAILAAPVISAAQARKSGRAKVKKEKPSDMVAVTDEVIADVEKRDPAYIASTEPGSEVPLLIAEDIVSKSDIKPTKARKFKNENKKRGNDDDEEDDKESSANKNVYLAEEGVLEWKIEKIIGVRYADLELEESEKEPEPKKPLTEAEEDAKFARDLKLQLKKRMALPREKRRGGEGWDTLEYLIKWRGLSHNHIEWVSPALLKEHGMWGPMRGRRFLESPEGQAMLDDDEMRMAQGKDWPPLESYYEEDCTIIEQILSQRHVLVDDSDFGITAKAAGAVRLERLERAKALESDAAQKYLKQQQEKQSSIVKRIEQFYTEATTQVTKELASMQQPDMPLVEVTPQKITERALLLYTKPQRDDHFEAALEPIPQNIIDLDSDEIINDGKKRRLCYLVKWKGMPYSESTWEWAEDVKDDEKVKHFKEHNVLPTKTEALIRARLDGAPGEDVRPPSSTFTPYTSSPKFKGGREIRDYQLEGVNWLIFNWLHRRNSILADEMGLGKTVQTVAVLNHLHLKENVHGPFLVIAPLSTLGHWKREFDEWTDMHCVYYHDPSQGDTSRSLIRKYEWNYSGRVGKRLANLGVYKFNVILTSYHVLLMDWEYFKNMRFRYVVVDEAHALKNRESQLQHALQSMNADAMLLLTGTPLQNDTFELWALLKLVRPDKFGSRDDFVEKYGDLKTSEQVMALQNELQTIMLRRVKEDVEKSIPPKEETLIYVELTSLQKQYYRAIFERNRSFLTRGATTGPPSSLISIEMELRKCCNHPFLLRNTEARETANCKSEADRQRVLVDISGKMVLLGKLLPYLRKGGHRLLIFSQFKTMLNLLEDLLKFNSYRYERIDGGIRGNERQAAIDRFNKPGSDIFAFLLSTKAGGQGINLMSADTVIIFDSDWNPQNDVQAMARAHRIGQTKDVRVFRLVTNKTYEAEMFKRASRKLGLSHAVFVQRGAQKPRTDGGDDEEEEGGVSGLLSMEKEKVEALLRFGAYAIADDNDRDISKEFTEASIEKILSKSVTVRYDTSGQATNLGETSNRVNLNLSKASFKSEKDTNDGVDVSDPSFWEKVLGKQPHHHLLFALQNTPSVLKASYAEFSQWVADLTAYLDHAHHCKNENTPHESAETLATILAMLTSKGKETPHPCSEAGMMQRTAMMPAATTRSAQVSAKVDEKPPLPLPSMNLLAVLGTHAATAATARSLASNGKGPWPESDEDCVQNSGTMAEFAEWWQQKMDSSVRQRKRQRAEMNKTTSAVIDADDDGVEKKEVRRKSIGGGGGRSHKSGGSGKKKKKKKDPLGEDDDEDDDDNDDDDVIMIGSGAGAGWSKNKARIILPEFEVEGDLDTGMPSRSGLRVRLSRWKPDNVGVQYAQELDSSADSKWTAVPPISSPVLATAKLAKSPALGKSPAAAAAATAASAAGATAASQAPKLPFNATMPAFLFQKTGPTRTQVIAAAALNLGTREYLAMSPTEVAAATVKANAAAAAAAAAATSSTAVAVESTVEEVPPGTSLLKLALRDYERDLTRRVASWLLTRKLTHADAVAPVLEPSKAIGGKASGKGENMLVSVPIVPLRILVIYTSEGPSKLTLKPDRVVGSRMAAPLWALEGRPVDLDEEAKREERKQAWIIKQEHKKQQIKSPPPAAAAAKPAQDEEMKSN